MGLLLRAGQSVLAAAIVGGAISSCYSAGNGTSPPTQSFYFPVGLAVSPAGDVLYAINSDFDLQFSGGTLQSYDLNLLRAHAAALVRYNLNKGPLPGDIKFLGSGPTCAGEFGPSNPPSGGVPQGQGCSPPVALGRYLRSSVILGAFATDLQLAPPPPFEAPQSATDLEAYLALPRRLFAPVRGVAAVTWADVGLNADPFAICCGQGPGNGCGSNRRCSPQHDTGNDPNQPAANTRHVTMPGEPFSIAQSSDGLYLAVTHQSDTKTSLLTTGLDSTAAFSQDPSLQFVLDGMPLGGDGIATIPHDPHLVIDGPSAPGGITPCDKPKLNATSTAASSSPCLRTAFLETNHSTPEIDLLRLYKDDGSTLQRPFIQREAVFALNSNAVGTDSRGIVIDPTPRSACRQRGGSDSDCARVAARVFFASRAPPALGIGEVGGPPLSPTGVYNPDQFVLKGNAPTLTGPSNIYLAPIVNADGNLELRVFLVLFDSSEIAVYDPARQRWEQFIDVGPGPFAMAFDPFFLDDVGREKKVAALPVPYSAYRFAYVASFTESFVQIIDLAQLNPDTLTSETFEHVVFTLGQPTLPKGQ